MQRLTPAICIHFRLSGSFANDIIVSKIKGMNARLVTIAKALHAMYQSEIQITKFIALGHAGSQIK